MIRIDHRVRLRTELAAVVTRSRVALLTSFLIDREGRVRHEVKGIFAEPALRMAVGHLLEEPASVAGPPGGGR